MKRLRKQSYITLVSIAITLCLCISLSISAVAAIEKSKITFVEIKRAYEPLVSMVDASKVVYKNSNNNCTMTTIPLYKNNSVGVGEKMDLKFYLYAKDEYDFSWLKESSCTSSIGTVRQLVISADKKSATMIFTADPLPVELSPVTGLKWNGMNAKWDEIPYAKSYEISLYQILPNGKLSTKMTTVTTSNTDTNMHRPTHLKPGDYVFSVQAKGLKNEAHIISSKKVTLPYNRSLLVEESDIGYYGGNWNTVNKKMRYRLKEEDRDEYNVRYLTNGRFLVEGEYYCFDINGNMLTGWQQAGGAWSFHSEQGIGQNGWLTDNGNTYYLNPVDGEMVTGWADISYKRYYFDNEGSMLIGWHKIDNYIYYFNKDGSAQTTSLVDKSGNTYHFTTEGKLIKK